jgi:hypothetical protein
MKAGPNKMNSGQKALTVQWLELCDKVAEYQTHVPQIWEGYLVLVHELHTRDELAVVCIISLREDTIEQAGP